MSSLVTKSPSHFECVSPSLNTSSPAPLGFASSSNRSGGSEDTTAAVASIFRSMIALGTTPSPFEARQSSESPLDGISPFSPFTDGKPRFAFKPLEQSYLARKYPLESLEDTAVIERVDGEFRLKSIRVKCNIFRDDEILKIHPAKSIHHLPSGLIIEQSEEDTAIIQQQSIRGCVAASISMLLKDRGFTPTLEDLTSCNLADDDYICKRALEHHLEAIKMSFESLAQMKASIDIWGPCELTLNDPAASWHSVVIDRVSEDLSSVTLRDPYHGWQITVHASALLRRTPMTMIHLKVR